jgi:hypothetical protein
MRFHPVEDLVSKLAPLIVVLATLSLALASWSDAWRVPFWVAAVLLLVLAVALFARGGFQNWLRGQTKPMEQLGFNRNRDQLWFEMNAKGMPRGYRAVVFIAWLGFLFSGLQFPYLAVAMASTLLALAWGYRNRRYPADDPVSK